MWIEDDTPKENKMKCYSCKKPLRFWQKGFIIGTTFVHEKCYGKDKKSSSDVDNVNINKDGIVSLNLDNEFVQKQLFAQVRKLKNYTLKDKETK